MLQLLPQFLLSAVQEARRMTFNRIAFAIIALTASAILAYSLTLATSATDYAILGATGAASAILLAVLARHN